MPNWCANRLTVVGAKEEVDRFAARVARGLSPERAAAAAELIEPSPERTGELAEGLAGDHTVLTFDEHAPQPTFTPGSDEWYPWRTSHWGTKWDASSPTMERSTRDDGLEQLTYSFDTAWSPPAPWFETAARAHPELTLLLLWNEEQAEAGWFVSEDGQLGGGDCDDPAELIEMGWDQPPYLRDAEDFDAEDFEGSLPVDATAGP